jgi:hypothetical protein
MPLLHKLPGILLAATFFAAPAQAAKFQAWETTTSTDEMEGTESYYINTESKNVLEGWLGNGRVLLGYNCQRISPTQGRGALYLRANGIGFHTEDSEVTGSGIEQSQWVRMKVDDGEPHSFSFRIWEDNNDGMTAVWPNSSDEREYAIPQLIQEMKAGRELLAEVTLFNTKGRDQIARFSLMGFTAAVQWCQQRT